MKKAYAPCGPAKILALAAITLGVLWVGFAQRLACRLAAILNAERYDRETQQEQAAYLLQSANVIMGLRDEYIFVVQSSCPQNYNQTTREQFFLDCGKQFVESNGVLYSRGQLQLIYSARQLTSDYALDKLQNTGSWWSAFGRAKIKFSAALTKLRQRCSIALRTSPTAPTTFWQAREIESCVDGYRFLLQTAFELAKANSDAYRNRQEFDSWLVLGPMSFVVDGIQAWNSVVRYAPRAAVEATAARGVAPALQELTLHLNRLFYFSQVVLMAMPRFEPDWTVNNMVELGLGHHFTWLSQALSVVDVYFAGGGSYMPPNWSQEIITGGDNMYQFALRCHQRMLAMIQNRLAENSATFNFGVVFLISLSFVKILLLLVSAALIFRQVDFDPVPGVCAEQLLSAPMQNLSKALHLVQKRLKKARSDITQESRDALLLLHMKTDEVRGALHRIQPRPDDGSVMLKHTVNIPAMMKVCAAQYRDISRSNIIVECDLPARQAKPMVSDCLQSVLLSLLDASVQRAQDTEVHMSCRFLSLDNMLKVAEHFRRPITPCTRPGEARTCTGLLFVLTDGGPGPNLGALSGTGMPLWMQSVQNIIENDLKGHLMISRRLDHDQGLSWFVILPLAEHYHSTEKGFSFDSTFQSAAPAIESARRNKASILVPGIGRMPTEWTTEKVYSTREDILRPASQRFTVQHYVKLKRIASDKMQRTTAPVSHIISAHAGAVNLFVAASHKLQRAACHYPSAEAFLSAIHPDLSFISNSDLVILHAPSGVVDVWATALYLRSRGFTGVCLIASPSLPEAWAKATHNFRAVSTVREALDVLFELVAQSSGCARGPIAWGGQNKIVQQIQSSATFVRRPIRKKSRPRSHSGGMR